MKPTRKNPIGISVTDVLLLGGAAWLLLSPNGQTIINTLFPAPDVPGQAPGAGTSTGQVPGQPGAIVVPVYPQFRIVRIAPPLVVVPGMSYSVTVSGSYLGPAGQYVVGVEYSNGWPGALCFAGTHDVAIQTAEVDLHVPDSGAQFYWSVSPGDTLRIGHPIIGGGPSVLQWRVYIRNLQGSVLMEQWHCFPSTQVF